MSAGAYGFVMSSTYNSRPLLPEILVEGATSTCRAKRQTYADLVAREKAFLRKRPGAPNGGPASPVP